MTTVVMRVTVPDRPGALGALATAVGQLGGNIADVDVHELDGSDVVADELVIDVPDEVTPGEVRLALLDAGALSVVSRSVQHRGMDALVRCLDAVRLLLSGDGALDAAVRHLVSTGDVEVGEPDDEVEREAFERRLPVARPIQRDDGSAGWVLAVPYPEDDPHAVVVVRRPGNVRFSSTEIARVRALLRVQQEVDRLSKAGLGR